MSNRYENEKQFARQSGKTNAPVSDGQPSATIPETEPETKAGVKVFLDEHIGDPETLTTYELQRRNELEKLLLARIERRRLERGLIHVNAAKKLTDVILSAVVAGLKSQSLPDKCGPVRSSISGEAR